MLENHDRVARKAEAPGTDWGLLDVGVFDLTAGQTEIKISALEIPGEETIELKGIIINRIE